MSQHRRDIYINRNFSWCLIYNNNSSHDVISAEVDIFGGVSSKLSARRQTLLDERKASKG